MATETEHKYLVINNSYLSLCSEKHTLIQGYLSRLPERTIRIRILDNQGFLTVKGKNHGATRSEFEYQIPYTDALQLLKLCEGKIIHKTRYIVLYEGNRWEVDEFDKDLNGLIIAEIEIPSDDFKYNLPPFVGQNVTDDPRYYNSNL